jgi:uncharacterized membrane protein (UPF0182 family)
VRNPSDLPPRRPRNPQGGFRLKRPGKGRIIATAVIGLIVAIFLSAKSVSGFYVDALWHDVLGRGDIFWGTLKVKAALGTAFVATFVVLMLINGWLADRIAPTTIAPSPEERALAGYRQLVGRKQWVVRSVLAVVLGLMVGLPAMTQWQEWLLFKNHQSFGINEALFSQDISFYVFRLPFAEFVVNWLFGALVLVTVVSVAIHYLNGGIRLQVQGRKVTPQAKAHLSVLFAGLAVVRAAGYWLSRFSLTDSTRGVVQGATYTDVNAQLPATNLMILVSLAVAVLFLWNVRLKGWRIPVLATLMWMLTAVVAGTIYPAIIQRFSVQPNVSTKELPYIENNLVATKAAFNIDAVTQESLNFGPITAADVSANETPLRDVRQLDPLEMRDRFALDEGKTSFYAIRDLDVDRYVIDGRLQQVILGSRELNTEGIPNRTWVSRHLIYTHGCGVVAAPASRVTVDGRPTYIDLGVKKPQLYVGEGLDGYSIVGTNQIEQACPDTSASPYSGTGGVQLSSPVRRVAFALHFGEYNLFGSNLISSESQIMWIRNVKERVQKIAPFFQYDSDPYPAVVDGRVVWIVDAFTTTSRYPNSQSANTDQLPAGSGLNTNFNYVRNSVKVVVDAYSGATTFYQVDAKDPIANAWGKAFPELLTPVAEAPADLVAHFRYPEDLFRVQTNMYGRYQFDDPTLFFNRDAAWSVAQAPPTEPEGTTGVVGSADTSLTPDMINVQDANVERFEPYFTIFHAPGATESNGVFSMLRPFVPFSSDNARKELRALMVVSSDPRTYGQLTVYKVGEPLPEGPATVAAEFGSDPNVSQQVTLLDQRGSRVIYGDLQIVPISKGLVYVRPLFVRPDDASARQVFVRKMLASYNNKVVIADDLTTAITRLFPGYAGSLGDRVSDGGAVVPDSTIPDSGNTTQTTVPSSVPSSSQSAPELLAQAEVLFDQADAALAQTPPDFAAYQSKLSQARELIRQALQMIGN